MRRALLVVLLAGLSACSLLTDFDSLSNGPAASDASSSGGDGGGGDGAPGSAPDARAMTDAADAASNEGGSSPITLVQSANAQAKTAALATLPATIAPTASGNVVIVAVTQDGAANNTVLSIVDNALGTANSYVSAGARTADSACGNTVEIWYAANVRAGATTVTVNLDSPGPFEVWVMEVSGLSTTAPREAVNVLASQPAGTAVAAPSVTTAARAFVVSTVATCGNANELAASSTFTPLPTLNGQDTAYLVTSGAGSYAAAWSTTNSTWAASTVAFH